ncbi:MAG: carboxypeptidase regulatory-like domain-containing protein [Gemmatimonas sp.]|jgi:hypothetical protein|uniref:TonB-dependent receptor n=1 Tax=Gemmatimonas sp. TaxID=1962908 RepID=UPI00391F7FA1
MRPTGRVLGFIAATLLPAGVAAQSSRAPSAVIEAQPPLVSVALIDVPLVEALEALSQSARMNLVWQATTLGEKASRRIACRFTNARPEDVLGCITRGAGLDYVRLSSGTYVVIPGPESALAPTSFAGVVVDAATGAPLPAARVQLAEVPTGVLTQDDGGFAFPALRPGRYALTVRAVGYRPYRTALAVDPRSRNTVRLPMERAEAFVRPIVVNGIRPGAASAELGNGTLADRAGDRLLAGPATFLPGVVAPLGVARRDGTGDLHLQGGDVGEHPWRLDGIPLYDVTALSGLLGMVSPAAVERMTVRRSGFRASHGSFASGVIDLDHAVAPPDGAGTPTAEVSVDPIAASARLSSPVRLGQGTGHVMVAGRTGLWQWTAPSPMVRALREWSVPDPVLLARVSGFTALPGHERLDYTEFGARIGDERVSLQDVHAATRVSWGVAHQLDASAFVMAHGVAYDGTAGGATSAEAAPMLHATDDYAWRTAGGQAAHRWLLGTRVRQHVQLRASSHRLQHTGGMRMLAAPAAALSAREDNGITELAALAEWQVTVNAHTQLALGTELARASSHLDLGNRVLRPIAFETSVTRGTAFGDATIALGRRHHLEAGLRVTQLQSGRTYAEPRLALRGERAGGPRAWAWRIAGGGYHQFVNQFDVASTMPVAFVPSMRFWLPSDGTTPVAQSWHLATEGVLRPGGGWEVRGEGYGRWQPSIPMFDYGVMYDTTGVNAPLGEAASFVARSDGRAVGGGVRIIRETSVRGVEVRSELAYDVGSAARRFPSRFGGVLQPPSWLEPHRVLLAGEMRPLPGVVLAGRSRAVWGRPWALRQAYYDLFGAAPMQGGLPIAMPGAAGRPAVFDLDLAASWTRGIGRSRVEVGMSVTNVLDRQNVLDFGLRRRGEADDYARVPRVLPGRQIAFTVQLRR